MSTRPARAFSPRSDPIFWAAAAVFLSTLLLSVWRNDFPSYYHPDELAKVAQVISGERNFNHPPLMLTAASAVLSAGSFTAEPERVVQIGRWLSACYLAAANALLTVVAGFYGGALAASLAGCLLVANPQAILAGHYFKEDPLLLLGLALVVAAGAWRWRWCQSWVSLGALGVAVGVAISAKYLGALALVYISCLEAAVPANAPPRRWQRLGVLWLTVAGSVVALNAGPVFAHSAALRGGIAQVERVTREGNDSIGVPVPHLHFVGMFFVSASPVALLGLALAWRELFRGWRARMPLDLWLLALAPFGILLLLSFSAIVAVRYLLPVNALAGCVGGVGLATSIQRIASRRFPRFRPGLRVVFVFAAAAVAISWSASALMRHERGFGIDDRALLRAWIRDFLPLDAVIAQDDLASLNGPTNQVPGDLDDALPDRPPLPNCLLSRKSVADFGDLEALRAAGVTHVVVCRFGTRRYLDADKRPAAAVEADFVRRRAFYRQLGETARLLWKSELAEPLPLHPGLELYALRTGNP